jgi:hypothetical protein
VCSKGLSEAVRESADGWGAIWVEERNVPDLKCRMLTYVERERSYPNFMNLYEKPRSYVSNGIPGPHRKTH